jgi:cytoskeletal protein RodZ
VSSRDDQARPAGSNPPIRRPSLTRPRLPTSLPGEPGRLVGRRRGGERPPTDPLPPAEPPVGERLAAARERKGVDLQRAERDTKIRIRYLAALERGDFRDLPGAVYTKGFLRNYAIYLGLDPEDVLRQWRRERGEGPSEPIVVVPAGLEAPRQAFTIGRGTIIAVLLAVGVVAFVVYLVMQLVRFSQPPNVAVTDPLAAVTQVDAGASSYTLRGTSLPGATVAIDTPGRETVRVTAGSDGRWSSQVDLVRGRNQFDVTATDPDTGKTSAAPVTVYITVPLAAATAPAMDLTSPADGATFSNGAVPVQGTATNADTVTVSASYLGPAPGTPASAKPASAPAAPKPASTPVAKDGSFSIPIQLASGRWALSIVANGAAGQAATVPRTVTVSYSGASVVVVLKGGSATLKAWVDGVLDPRTGAAGKKLADGKSITLTGATSVELRTSDASVTYATVNGIDLGRLSKNKGPGTWLFAPPKAPERTDRQ